MNNEEKDIFEFMSSLKEEEEIRLFESWQLDDEDLSDLQRKRIKTNVLKNVSKGKNKKNIKRGIIAASIGVTLVLGSFTPFGQKAIAEISNIIYFVPGIGKVVESKDRNVYVLAESINYPYNDGIIVVKSIIKDSESMIMRFEGGVSGVELKIMDDKGNSYKHDLGSSAESISEYSFYNLPKDLTTFSIILSNNAKIPIILESAKNVTDYASMGPSDIKSGLGLTIIPTVVQDKVRLNLVEHVLNGREISFYGYTGTDYKNHTDISIKDENGKLYNLEDPKASFGTRTEFYFTPDKNISNLSIKIPQITLKYKINEEISLPIPKNGDLQINKTLNLKGFVFEITKVTRQEDKFRVYVSSNYDENKNENLTNVYLEALRNKRIEPNASYGGYSWQFNENAVVTYYEFKIKPEDKTMILQLKDLYTNIKGPWNFKFALNNQQ